MYLFRGRATGRTSKNETTTATTAMFAGADNRKFINKLRECARARINIRGRDNICVYAHGDRYCIY